MRTWDVIRRRLVCADHSIVILLANGAGRESLEEGDISSELELILFKFLVFYTP